MEALEILTTFLGGGITPVPAEWSDLVVGGLCTIAGYVSFKDQLLLTA